MKNIDKTKEKLRLHELDDNQKKDLFKKFKAAGGEVLSDNDKRRGLAIDREKQKQHQQRLDEHYRNLKSEPVKMTVKAGSANRSAKKVSASQVYDSPFNRFRIRMRLRILKVTGFNTLFFNEKFISNFTGQYKTSLMEIQMAYLTIFKRDLSTGNRIIARLDKTSPLYYGVIERAGEIFEPMIIDQITENYLNFPSVPQPVTELKEPLMSLLRSLYIIKPYENTLINSFERAMDYYNELSETKSSKNLKKRDVRNSLFIIFNKLYPRLHTLCCHYNGVLFDEIDKRIEDIFEITPAEKPDNRDRLPKYRPAPVEEKINIPEESQNPQQEEDANADVSVKEGLKMMYKLNFAALRKLYDKKNRFEILQDNDKILLVYLLFLEFESEYSMILTTNQIKFNIDFSSSAKLNYKEALQDLFNRMRKCHEAFAAYYDAYSSFYKIKNERPIGNDQYITYAKRLDEKTERKDQIGNLCRNIIKAFMESVSTLLEELVEDMNLHQFYVNNPQDILEFQYEIEGDKILKDKKIYDAIQIVQRFASAIVYRLSSGGDLTGNTEFSDNTNRTENPSDSEKSAKTESILDELDDII